MTNDRYEIRHLPEEARYVLINHGEDGTQEKSIGEESYLDVERDGRRERILYHTLVDEEYSGQGLASRLVRAALDHLISEGRVAVPVCPYVAAWLPKHPEYAGHVVEPTADHRRALRGM